MSTDLKHSSMWCVICYFDERRNNVGVSKVMEMTKTNGMWHVPGKEAPGFDGPGGYKYSTVTDYPACDTSFELGELDEVLFYITPSKKEARAFRIGMVCGCKSQSMVDYKNALAINPN